MRTAQARALPPLCRLGSVWHPVARGSGVLKRVNADKGCSKGGMEWLAQPEVMIRVVCVSLRKRKLREMQWSWKKGRREHKKAVVRGGE